MRKLAYVAEISALKPIEGADRLEEANLKGLGWRVVVGKGDFKVGDLCVMFEIDSFLDADDERYAFLKERCLRKFVSKGGAVLRQGIRIKTIKLRGVVSQGLLMPISKFPEILSRVKGGVLRGDGSDTITLGEEGVPDVFVQRLIGVDLSGLLHVEHYDDVKEQLQPSMGNPINGDAMGKFPTDYVPRTDEERIQNLGDWFETKKGRKWQVTVKHDGTSATIIYSPSIDPENPDFVCSRNLRLKRESASGSIPVYWQMAEKYDMLGKLKRIYEETNGHEFAIQGEIVGPGINSDRNREQEYIFRCFRIWDIKEQKFLSPNETVKFCEVWEIPHVYVVETDFPFFDKIQTMEDALKFAEGKTPEGNEREGVVCKTCDDGPYMSFKIVSNKYLLKQEG